MATTKKITFKNRFRGFLPVVVDVETGGINSQTDALLEIALVMLNIDENGTLSRAQTFACHVLPFEGAILDPKALEINHIDPYHPFRRALTEEAALEQIFTPITAALKEHKCHRAVLVGHNSWFDLAFLKAAIARVGLKHSPFHRFTSLDTATLSALAYGETVLSKSLAKAGFEFNAAEAHSAIYDAEKTADLFCAIFNRWLSLSSPI
jgi:ribonuclease T